MRHGKWLLLLILVVADRVEAQRTTLTFEQIEGLSQSTGYSIMQDRRGFIWVATADGLNRYDGIEMKIFRPTAGKKGSMVGRIIRSELTEDANGHIWFSTDVGLHSFDPVTESFTIHPLSDDTHDQANIFANPILLDREHLWLASMSHGVYDFDMKTRTHVRYPQTLRDENNKIIQLMYNGVDDGQSFWFATNKGLLSFDRGSHTWNRYFSGSAFYSISIIGRTLFVTSGRDVFRVMRANDAPPTDLVPVDFQKLESGAARDFIHKIYVSRDSILWVGDESGNVYSMTPSAPVFQWRGNINIRDEIRTNYPVYSFYADTLGTLWIGAYMLGVMKAETRPPTFSVFPTPQPGVSTPTVFVNAFYQQSESEIWLGTFQKGIIALDLTTGKTKQVALPYVDRQLIYGKSVHLIRQDSEGNLWTGASGQLFVREKGSKRFEAIMFPPISNALQNAQAWCSIEYNDGWLFGTTVGLFFAEKVDGRYSVKHLDWLGLNRIATLWQAPNEDVWIGLESGGIMIVRDIINGSGSTTLFADTNARWFAHDPVHELVWICTSNGLVAWHLPSGEHRSYVEKDGLANSYTYTALLNGDQLWVGTNAGLVQATLDFTEASRFPNISFVNFTEKDGLPDHQFNIRAAYQNSSGMMFFGTPRGVAYFELKEVQPNRTFPNTVMTYIGVNGSPADTTVAPEYLKSIHVQYFENSFLFRFRGLEPTNPTKVQYAVRLDGWDRAWIQTGTLNEVRYNNLPPGSYTFHVKAANSSGIWNEQPVSISLRIEPPFWQTWWFYVLIAAILTMIVVAVTRRMAYLGLQKKLADLERQRELDRERQRISREMHDDIGAGLTQITLMSEFAKSKNGTTQKELDEIAGTSRKLVSAMSEITWSLNPDNRKLEQLLSYLREQLSKQLEYSGIDYQIEFPDNDPQVVLSNEVRRDILLIMREIVNNSIRHSQANHVKIQAGIRSGNLVFEVADNGIGFNPERAFSGNGLKNIKDRALRAGANLSIESQPGGGSRFELWIRL